MKITDMTTNEVVFESQLAEMPKWAQEMDAIFENWNYSPTIEMLGAGCFVFFFYDLPNNQRLGINDECIVLYTSDPDCEGIWSYYFPSQMAIVNRTLCAVRIYELMKVANK